MSTLNETISKQLAETRNDIDKLKTEIRFATNWIDKKDKLTELKELNDIIVSLQAWKIDNSNHLKRVKQLEERKQLETSLLNEYHTNGDYQHISTI